METFMFKTVFLRISLYAFFTFIYMTMLISSGFDYLYTMSNQVILSRVLYIAADLELADHLIEPLSIEDLAQKTDCNISSLKRLLRYLIECNVFMYNEKGLICNNDVSLFLQKNHPHTIRPFILHDDPTRWNALGNLGFSIKTGTPSFNMLYNTDFFSYINDKPQLSKRFDEAMTIISQQEDRYIAEKIHFYGTIADIGGGKGQLLENIYKIYPSVKQLILFDLEQVQQNIIHNPWITYVSGSFFDPITLQADIFILKRILHDWNDEKALQILHNVSNAMKDDSILYIVDAVIDQCRDKQLILDIDLRLLSIFGGQERTFAEWQALCTAADLEVVAIQELTSISHIITCKKKEA